MLSELMGVNELMVIGLILTDGREHRILLQHRSFHFHRIAATAWPAGPQWIVTAASRPGFHTNRLNHESCNHRWNETVAMWPKMKLVQFETAAKAFILKSVRLNRLEITNSTVQFLENNVALQVSQYPAFYSSLLKHPLRTNPNPYAIQN